MALSKITPPALRGCFGVIMTVMKIRRMRVAVLEARMAMGMGVRFGSLVSPVLVLVVVLSKN